MILTSAFTSWYWTYNKCDVPSFALSSAIVRTLRYHFGTIAFGSLFMPISRSTRTLFGIGSSRRTWRPLICLQLTCNEHCEPLLEVFQRFNRNAYIMSAVYGKELNRSAFDAYQLIFRNCSRYITTDSITWIAFYIGKILMACVAFVALYMYYDTHLTSVFEQFFILFSFKHGICITFPLICVTLGAYLIFDLFITVYTVAVDTLALCAREYTPTFFSVFLLLIFHVR